MPAQVGLVNGKRSRVDEDGDEIMGVADEIKRLEEENKHLEEENKRLELRNKLLEKNKELRQKGKELQAQNHQLKKRKAGDVFDDYDYGWSPTKKLRHSAMEGAVRKFFSSPRFAVAGASSEPQKYGHKVFVWFLDHKLNVTPINPSTPMITTPPQPPSLMKRVHLARPSLSTLPGASETSLSIITPPNVTRGLLEEAKKVGIRAVWLQPGSFDHKTLEYARKTWPGAAIAGEDVPGSNGHHGWCVLVDGDAGLDLVRREATMVNGKL